MLRVGAGGLWGREKGKRISEGQEPHVACLLPNPHSGSLLLLPPSLLHSGLEGSLTHLLRAAEMKTSPALPALSQVIPDQKIIPISQN